jgi:hypothetical protein
VVTVACGSPFMSVVRYSSCVAVNFCGISPRNATSTSRLRSTVPGGVLEALRRLVERVVAGRRAGLALDRSWVRTDPLGTG